MSLSSPAQKENQMKNTRREVLLWGGYSEGGSIYVSGKLPTYPSPKPTLAAKWLTSHLEQNIVLGEG